MWWLLQALRKALLALPDGPRWGRVLDALMQKARRRPDRRLPGGRLFGGCCGCWLASWLAGWCTSNNRRAAAPCVCVCTLKLCAAEVAPFAGTRELSIVWSSSSEEASSEGSQDPDSWGGDSHGMGGGGGMYSEEDDMEQDDESASESSSEEESEEEESEEEYEDEEGEDW